VDLSGLSEEFRRRFDAKMAAREQALAAARRSIRASANAIRAIHRGDLDQAHRLMADSAEALRIGREAVLVDHPDIFFAGFMHDAQKEYVEARSTEAIVTGGDLPSAGEMEVGPAAYLNGLAESIGEGRRAILDLLRQGEVGESERVLGVMEDVYHVLVAMDYPDAITGNLRRSTDVARSLLEKTRGDLSLSQVQRTLREALDRHARDVLGRPGPQDGPSPSGA
jgi:translin